MLTLLMAMAQTKPPKDAVVLFDGSSVQEWVHRKTGTPCEWTLADGTLTVKPGTADIVSVKEFGDQKIHIEFCLPLEADKHDQARSNSGVYVQGRYEVQILDSWENKTYATGGCGGVYGIADPLVDAIKKPGEWNSYDIEFRSAKLDKDGEPTEFPVITVWHNGKLIHDKLKIDKKCTAAGFEGPWVSKGPLMLQNHGSAVKFRNIWVKPL